MDSAQDHNQQPHPSLAIRDIMSRFGVLIRAERRVLGLILSYALAIGLFSLIVPLTVQELVNTLFMGFIGALALAAGLAFGLGGRDTAGQIVQNWYNRGRANQPKMERAAENMERQAKRNIPSTQGADD